MAGRRLRVWVVSPEVHRHGGTERCLAEQLERWRDRFELRLYTMGAEGVDLDGIEVRRLPRLPGPHLARWVFWYLANTLRRRLDARRGAPDVVYSPGVNCPDADVVSVHIIFAKYWERVRRQALGDLPRIARAARSAHRALYVALLRRLEAWTYGGPAMLVALSRQDAGELERRFGRPHGRVVAMSNGVDAGRFSPGSRLALRTRVRQTLGLEGRTVALLVGNDAYTKGADVAIRALAGLPEHVVLALAGGMDEAAIRRWARGAGVEARVLVWPHRPDVEAYYAAADLLIAPSREDAYALPPLEAMACGLPVIVSARAGVAELVEDGRDALVLHDPEDPVALAGAIRRVVDDPSLARRLGERGRRRAEQLSWDENAARQAAVIEAEASTPRVMVLGPHPAGVGGIERVTRTLLGACSELYGPDRVALCAVWRREGSASLPCRLLVAAAPAPPGAPARVSIATRVRFAAAAVRAARRWRRRLVVVAAHPHLSPVAWACRLVSGAPYAVWCHGYETWGRLRPSVRMALRRADLVFAPSAFSAGATERAAGLAAGSVRVLPHGLSPEVAADASRVAADAGKVVLAVARLDPTNAYKGVDTLLRALPLLRARVADARLVVVGDGADRPRLKAIARTLGVDGAVRFAGRVSDEELRRLYASAAVFALPAATDLGPPPRGEGFGLVFVEAGAAGLPVVAGAAGPVPEVVRDGEAGLLVDPADEQAVAEALCRLLTDPERALRMGEAGRRRAASEFSYEAFRARVADLIGALASRREDLRHHVRPGSAGPTAERGV